ncbi:Cif family virulence factor [Winogradskyella ursingii]|uniref:hypothetical protein n=1 Tax=Winogradskyella ursingii TaxID=2686079 RepID=UPI0015C8B050|nr:hypothetical protein [Winogradskyella ursingii]
MINSTFSYYEIKPVGNIAVELDNNLAVATFQWESSKALLKGGTAFSAVQCAAHVWKKIDGDWKIIHEHLTNVS